VATGGPSTTPSSVGTYKGTVTASGNDTTVTEQVFLGPIQYGAANAPPTEVLDSFTQPNFADPATMATSGYTHGQMTVSYVHGSLPANISFSTNSAFNGSNAPLPAQVLILNAGGTWDDGGQSQTVGFTFQPGQTSTFEFWIVIPGAINNAQLTIPQGTQEDMEWAVYPGVDQVGTNGSLAISGPQAARCGPSASESLLPYAHLPFTQAGETCIRKSGSFT
jgi:hypothetical protein